MSSKDFKPKLESNPTLATPTWEMPGRGGSYLQIRINRDISIAVIFSLLVHLLLLLTLAPKLLTIGSPLGDAERTITVDLAPPPSKSASADAAPSIPQVVPAPTPRPKPAVRSTKPRIEPPAEPQPSPGPENIIAVEKAAPDSVEVPLNRRIPVPAPAPIPSAPIAATDMMSYVSAQRARREAAQGLTARDSIEIASRDNPISDDERRSAIIKRNLQDEGTNGIFRIRELRSTTAVISFLGWKHEYSKARQELLDVQVGPDGDIYRAIAKKMIEVIRRDYSGDFNWESHRLDRTIILSARKEDNDGLEDFLMQEFFGVGGLAKR